MAAMEAPNTCGRVDQSATVEETPVVQMDSLSTKEESATAHLPSSLGPLLALISDDERPTLILKTSRQSPIAYRNAALDALISAHANDASFASWVAKLGTEGPDLGTSVKSIGHFGGRSWLSKRLGQDDWIIVYSGGKYEETSQESFHHPPNTLNGDAGQGLLAPICPYCPPLEYDSNRLSDWCFDWTRFPCNFTDPWIKFLQNFDWGKTALGPMRAWPRDLCQLVVYVLSAPDPRIILWGDDLSLIFNEPAKVILGPRYLTYLGNPLEQSFGTEVLDQDLTHLRRNLRNGTAVKEINFKYILTRNGFPEEAYFDFYMLPVPDKNGYLAGGVLEFNETTATVTAERKSRVASLVFDKTMCATDLETVWSGLFESIEAEPGFISHVSIYVRDDGPESLSSPEAYHVQGHFGTDCELVQTVHMSETSKPNSLAAALMKARESQNVVTLHEKDGKLPPELAITIEDGEVARTVCVLPIVSSSSSKHPLAFVIFVMNPRVTFTGDDFLLVGYIRDLISKSCSVLDLPKEQRQDQDLEDLNRSLLTKLRTSLTQMKKGEETFTRMARNAPFGMYMFAPDGTPKFVNEEWLKLNGFHTMTDLDISSQTGPFWRSIILPEDLTYFEEQWRLACTSKTPTKYEYRLLIRPVDSPNAEHQLRWVEATSFPELDEDNHVIAIQGWLMDISDRKLAENLMSQRLQDALETEKASERFIDMVSHEIRNPLSAILQLADGILTSLSSFTTDSSLIKETVQLNIDAAQTIILCAQHQKKIVDDVLVISKLDSDLLVLSPDRCHPPTLIEKALKMHESELARAQIVATLHVEESLTDNSVGFFLLDESRILQVVINLLTNAIKFTHTSSKRQITVTVGATRSIPTSEAHGVAFAPPRIKRPKPKDSHSSSLDLEPLGEDIHVYFTVKDTGRGLAKDEIDRLFQRFSQASPKTFKKYGGSGLGLYISKELTELQGGQIGVKSDGLGRGSTFGFYVKTRRCNPPLPTPSAEASIRITEFVSSNDDRNVISKTSATKNLEQPSSLHVLVVEDNIINQKVMAQQLRRLGCTVHVANHGIEALDFLATTVFQRPLVESSMPLHIILMDVEMPVMDGLSCTQRIRQYEETGQLHRRVPIIAVTANARNQQITKALEAGVDEVVTKPFRVPDLLPRMEALVASVSAAN